MNTKTFAQQSRALLMEGVANKLLYWGFKADGSTSDEPNPVAGGYTFRGKVYDDETVPKLWMSLQQSIKNKGIDVVKEEAAYTWFNRLMAIQIMAKNDYLDAQLAYVPGMANTPQILQKARQGQYTFLNSKEKERLKRIITDFSKEQETFALLLVGYCHSNKMLNNVFGRLDDYTELLLPDNMLQDTGFLHLLNTTDAISDEQYKEVELIGWLYQFYISERKDEVFASFKKKKKAEAKDIPAATQIFTPNWIVKYMVQNTVGKIWLEKNPDSKIKLNLKYLVENESDSNSNQIISEASQLTLIDPAVGSGHILVEGFDLIYQMYIEEYYTPEEAVESILKNNLFGLDLDERAAQLATFAILLKAAKQYRDVFAKGWLPNVYSMPEYATFSDHEIKDFLGSEGTVYEKELSVALVLMEQSKNLGSVMKLNLSDDAKNFIEKRFAELRNTDFKDFNLEIVYQKIKKFIPVLLLLTKKYASVVANPPYMGSGNMNDRLKNYIDTKYLLTKGDLCTVFMDCAFEFLLNKGKYAMINQTSWMYKTTFLGLRKHINKNYHIESMLHLGPRVFDELSGEVVQSTAFSVSKKALKENRFGSYFDLVSPKNSNSKESLFLNRNFFKFDINSIKDIPDFIIGYWISKNGLELFSKSKSLSTFGDIKKGLATGDDSAFLRLWFELSNNKIKYNYEPTENIKNYKWFPINKGGGYRKWSGNFEYVINWENDGETIRNFKDEKGKLRSRPQNLSFSFLPGITYNIISSKGFCGRMTDCPSMMSDAGPTIYNLSDPNYMLALLSSSVGKYYFKALCPGFKYDTGAVGKFPVIYLKDDFINLTIDNNVAISKSDWNSREIAYDFTKSPLINETKNIKEAFNNWKINVSSDFFELHKNEEELNSLFIKMYGLENELTPDVSLGEISILQEEVYYKEIENLELKFRTYGKEAIDLPINRGEVINQFISYAIGLFMGRYRLDKPGLNIAHPNPTKEELASYEYNHVEVIIDQDAILPIMGKNCNFNDDIVKQFNQLIDTIWGHEQRTENINFIQECIDKDLEKFIVNDFWKYHCVMYKKTPIYWLFSSKKGAFQVLVYLHRMNEFTVEKIRANYLLEHLKYLKSEIAQKEANASSLSTAEAKQLDKLRADLIECEQYDMALKNVADQQIKFDLDDGVAKNYELFETVVAKIK